VIIFEHIEERKTHTDHHETTPHSAAVKRTHGSAERVSLSKMSLSRSPERSYFDVTLGRSRGYISPEDPERLARRHEPRKRVAFLGEEEVLLIQKRYPCFPKKL
jgi:hypothetical protein